MALIQVRVSDELKEEAKQVFENAGLDLSTAIRIFLKKSVNDEFVVFSFANDPETAKLRKLFDEMRSHSESIGNDKMTLEEINEEIRLAREERKKRL